MGKGGESRDEIVKASRAWSESTRETRHAIGESPNRRIAESPNPRWSNALTRRGSKVVALRGATLSSFQAHLIVAWCRRSVSGALRRGSLDPTARRLSLGAPAIPHRASDACLDPAHAAILFRDARGVSIISRARVVALSSEARVARRRFIYMGIGKKGLSLPLAALDDEGSLPYPRFVKGPIGPSIGPSCDQTCRASAPRRGSDRDRIDLRAFRFRVVWERGVSSFRFVLGFEIRDRCCVQVRVKCLSTDMASGFALPLDDKVPVGGAGSSVDRRDRSSRPRRAVDCAAKSAGGGGGGIASRSARTTRDAP